MHTAEIVRVTNFHSQKSILTFFFILQKEKKNHKLFQMQKETIMEFLIFLSVEALCIQLNQWIKYLKVDATPYHKSNNICLVEKLMIYEAFVRTKKNQNWNGNKQIKLERRKKKKCKKVERTISKSFIMPFTGSIQTPYTHTYTNHYRIMAFVLQQSKGKCEINDFQSDLFIVFVLSFEHVWHCPIC